jgi:hypothetical protein
MARTYFNSQSARGSGKFPLSPPLYKKAYLGPRSISRTAHHKNSVYTSKRPRAHNLPLRIKQSKMSTTPSQLKRTRLFDDIGDQPKKHRRTSSNLGKFYSSSSSEVCNNLFFLEKSSYMRELQNARCSSEPRTYPLFFLLFETLY